MTNQEKEIFVNKAVVLIRNRFREKIIELEKKADPSTIEGVCYKMLAKELEEIEEEIVKSFRNYL